MSAPLLSVVVPAFNEATSIESTVDQILTAVDEPERCELVLVDDGSDDGTLDAMRAIERSSAAAVVVVARESNGGMGQALASGFEVATGAVLTWIPGDGEYDLTEILPGVKLLADHDIVLVRRIARTQLSRNLVSAAMYGLIRILFRFDARRYCGIFVVGHERWRSLSVRSRDVFFTLEVAIRATSEGWHVAEVEAEWRPRRAGRSKVFNPRTIAHNVWELVRFRWRLWTERSPAP